MKRAASALEPLTGRRLPGGCDLCDSYQVLSRCADDLYVLSVHHEQSCPAYRAPRTNQ
jgi:hypothetical protein